MTTTQSFFDLPFSSNIKCFFVYEKNVSNNMIILLVVIKKLSDIFKEISHNIDVQRSKKNSQPLKCWRMKIIFPTLSIITEKKEIENKTNEEKKKEKEKKEKKDCGLFVVAYSEFLSDGLEVPSCGLSVETLRMRYASLLWNYEILKAQNDYVSNNEDPQRPRPKKAKIDENVVVTTID
ncbi:hypothetical protein EJD97_006214 [Solanum chilense]|uniref:Ubiquitin-like protease family profile domain-containing protein n=1 Tax=Solanum chilense TaxID=4083 RepID=A0A6N2BU13_SOLCI|nr:hypothetical protein EJD97_006214 [Solanum chilense]